MIIKNNFNSKNVDPLNDYTGIGKGSHSLDKELEHEKNGFNEDINNNPILSDFNTELDEEDEDGDNWKFFR